MLKTKKLSLSQISHNILKDTVLWINQAKTFPLET